MLVYLAHDAIAWVLVAAFGAMALNPAVEALAQRGLGRARAAVIVFVAALGVLAGLGALVIPPLVSATTSFVEALPGFLRDLDAERGPLAFLERHFHLGEWLVEIYEKGGIAALAILIGAELAGVRGALAAIPVACSVAVIAREPIRWRREASLHLPTAVEDGLRHTDP
jgi:predicted PurR-regulated permease PerM